MINTVSLTFSDCFQKFKPHFSFLQHPVVINKKINCLSALGEWFFRGYYVVERHWSCYHCLLNHPIE